MATLVRPKRKAIEIGNITEEILRGIDSGKRLRRHLRRTTRAEADNDEPAGHGFSPAEGLVFQPGTRTSEK
ncbi:hypothetical protein D3C71_1569980 [compost metagenome]